MKKKICSRCKMEYPASKKYFSKGKRHLLSNYCKYCASSIAKYYLDNIQLIKRTRETYLNKLYNRQEKDIPFLIRKKCPGCNKIKDRSHFFIDKGSPGGLCSYCKECKCRNSEKYRDVMMHRKEKDIPYPKNKKCSVCKLILPLKLFYKSRDNKDGLESRCKACSKLPQEKRSAKYYLKMMSRTFSEIIIPKKKKCPMCKKLKFFKKFSKNKRSKDGMDSYCILCRKKRLDQNGRREKMKQYHKKYEKEHRLRRNEQGRIRWKNDPETKMRHVLRSRIREALQSQGTIKDHRTEELVGCSIKYFISYIESKFTSGMTWKNYGLNGWSIDHIRPCISFNLLLLKEQKKCFNYKNLMPMWLPDNWKKGSHYRGVYITKRNRQQI